MTLQGLVARAAGLPGKRDERAVIGQKATAGTHLGKSAPSQCLPLTSDRGDQGTGMETVLDNKRHGMDLVRGMPRTFVNALHRFGGRSLG
jgi:hypothetical protein